MRLAPTATTLSQLAGVKLAASPLLLPAATTTVAPRAVAVSTAAWLSGEQLPAPPRLRLITSAGWGLAGTPGTVPPAAQTIASAMSEV